MKPPPPPPPPSACIIAASVDLPSPAPPTWGSIALTVSTLIHFIPELLRDSKPLFLKRQYDQARHAYHAEHAAGRYLDVLARPVEPVHARRGGHARAALRCAWRCWTAFEGACTNLACIFCAREVCKTPNAWCVFCQPNMTECK